MFITNQTLVDFVIEHTNIHHSEFYTEFCNNSHDIKTSADFLEFLAWWSARNEFRVNYLKNSWFGVVQQFRGLLTQEESDYIDTRSAAWFDGSSLRELLQLVCSLYPVA